MRPTELFSRDEIRALTAPSDVQGALSIAVDYGWCAAALAAVAAVPHPVTVAVAMVVIGGRQLGLAVLAHEAAHRSLFRTRWLNDLAGLWLCGAPVWLDPRRYRVHHQAHHSRAGHDDDPDVGLVAPYPITRGSLARKLARDLVGWTAARRIVGQLAMDLGLLTYTASTGARRLPWPGATIVAASAVRNLGPVVVANLALLGLLAAVGHPGLYLVWIGAWCTTHSVSLRIRAIAEHACTGAGADPIHHARTTLVSWPERLVLAPHHVNYHVEHHLLMTVPHWRLPALHRALDARGQFGPHNRAHGYAEVLRVATGGRGGTPAAGCSPA